jgi:hypothetical protein
MNNKEVIAFVQHRTRKQNHLEVTRILFHVSVNSPTCFPLKCVLKTTLCWAFREVDCRLFNCLPSSVIDYWELFVLVQLSLLLRASAIHVNLFVQDRWIIFHLPAININPLTPELNPSAQRCLTRFFTGYFPSWTVYFVNVWVKNQQMHQLLIQFINYVW